MKTLHGTELAGYIKERQAKQVRGLIQAHGITPRLAIVQTTQDPVIHTYVRLKRRYGADIQVQVDHHQIDQAALLPLVGELNENDAIHGIIIQLPLADPAQTYESVRAVAPSKDVDGLGSTEVFEPATPMAIMWLLAGYNIDLQGKQVLLIGRGKLVGAPLEKQLLASDIDVSVADRTTIDLDTQTREADVIITATGSPALLYSDMIKPGAIIVDAGVASEDGKTVGDVAPELYQRDDITITPPKGGVGPLTVCALFDNVIRATTMRVQR